MNQLPKEVFVNAGGGLSIAGTTLASQAIFWEEPETMRLERR